MLDTARQEVVATIKVADKLGPIALSADGQRAFVSVAGAIAIVDIPRRAVDRTIRFPGELSGLVPFGDLLYVIENDLRDGHDDGKVTAITVADGAVKATRAIWHKAGAGILSVDGRRLFIPHHFYTGMVTALDTDGLKILAVMKFEDGAKRILLSPDERRLYVPNGLSSSGRITVIDTATGRVSTNIDMGGDPSDLALSPDGRRGYAILFQEHAVGVISTETGGLEKTVAVPNYPFRLALNADGTTAYILSSSSNDITVLDTRTFSSTTLRLERKAHDVIGPSR